jgi:hypothetical protein
VISSPGADFSGLAKLKKRPILRLPLEPGLSLQHVNRAVVGSAAEGNHCPDPSVISATLAVALMQLSSDLPDDMTG